ncbi:unnamed protein product [Medioppia subpectinata]|uniref:Uncharacterized protein n=1 Tax=Medioppia subpectinata TaxID=1979941 RepID=A0A7R9L0K7_9ACAR|nr:unnamed protein product [Medioppia subpectinata]CAG2113073.1 unnamed protein product [Medioppia subpectinata]
MHLRHICSYLLWYCTHHKREALLNEAILLVGNTVVLNHENQALLESGQRPTVVQQLCSLPIEYFSDDRQSRVGGSPTAGQLSRYGFCSAEQRLTFAKRFPKNRWNEAKDYFEAQTEADP